MAATPISAANTASTTTMPVSSTLLSLEPNAEMAKFFTGGRRGVDGRTADGDHRRALRPGDPGDQLRDAQRDERGDQAGGHAQGAHPAGRGAGGAGG